MRRLATVLATLALLGFASGARASGPTEGIASEWGGPGAATHDCRFPWKDCAPRAVQSLDTGIVIIVKPQMYCDCFVGREGPNGETQRLIDLDPSQVHALGLDPAAGLFRVRVWFTSGQPLPDTAMADTAMKRP
jgi:hypothetical protein